MELLINRCLLRRQLRTPTQIPARHEAAMHRQMIPTMPPALARHSS